MSSHVVIISNARRYMIKTTPKQLINDILFESCRKAGQLDPQAYSLKYGSSILDLSLPVRLARLPAGAKLLLVKREYTQKDIKVALQIVNMEKRLTLSFPAQTTLWEILCHFELKADPPINITKRSIIDESENQINCYYEAPVVRIMNKEFNGPEILQNITLASQGIIDGNILLQVKFEKTQKCFNEIITNLPKNNIEPYKQTNEINPESSYVEKQPVEEIKCQTLSESFPQIPKCNIFKKISSDDLILNRKILVLSAPVSSCLYVSKVDTSEEDYEITVETAMSYQNILSSKAKGLGNQCSNIQKESKQKENLKCEIKFKLPDGMQIIGIFEGNENVQALYDFIKHVIRYSDEPFCLFITPPPKYLLDLKATLASDLKFSAKTTIIFKWKDTAQSFVKEHSVLKDTYLNIQKDISTIIFSPKDEEEEEKEEKDIIPTITPHPLPPLNKSDSKKVPKWLKLSK